MDNVYGLIICNSDKDNSLLDYHGQPQRYYLYEMLSSLCDEVFLTCNENQAKGIPDEFGKLTIDSEYAIARNGMAALLTAFKKHPKAHFLVIACDYPFINRHHLKKLVITDLDTIPAIAYYNKEQNHFEPLIAFYHNNIKPVIRKHFKNGDYSLDNVLKEVDAYTINAKSPDIVRRVQTPAEYKEVAELFRKFR